MSGQFTTPLRVMTEEVSCRGRSILHNLQGSNKALSGRQLQEAEAPGASKEDMGISQGRSTAYFVVKTRAILQECAKSPFKSRRKSQKPKPGKINQSRSCTLIRVTDPTYQNMWVIILQLMLLRLAATGFLATASTSATTTTCLFTRTAARREPTDPSAARFQGGIRSSQSTVLCQNQNTYIEIYPTSEAFSHSLSFYF
jgi:hypothetical protein